jgi:hypothetical protein
MHQKSRFRRGLQQILVAEIKSFVSADFDQLSSLVEGHVSKSSLR